MKITKIKIKNNGYVYCKSTFYNAHDILTDSCDYSFYIGINELKGEIDSGVWGISYLMSMYNYTLKDFVLFDKTNIEVNDIEIELKEFCQYSCYLDKEYPLFNSKKSIRKLVDEGLKKTKLNYTADEIRNLFKIDSERYERPIFAVGNEIFKAMVAVGYANNKQVFCFPWMSKMRYDGYHNHFKDLLSILSKLDLVVILPLGQ